MATYTSTVDPATFAYTVLADAAAAQAEADAVIAELSTPSTPFGP